MAADGPVSTTERRARVILSRVVEPGDVDACRLVEEFSAAALVTRLSGGDIGGGAKVQGWAQRLAATDVDALLHTASRVGARYVCPGDHEWPPGLADLHRCESQSRDRQASVPFGLWVRGDADLAGCVRSAVSMVGARSATEYGEHVAAELAYGCVESGLAVVSGAAYGIDASAHRGALAAGGTTCAVTACGIDRAYPAAHTDLLDRIAASGVVVTEAAPGCVPTRSRFLVRNRLIAALTAGTVVVEAALRSGSLNTARWAQDLGRGVMGVPGPVTSKLSGGVHQLLRQPETLLVTDAAEIVEHVSPVGSGLAPSKSGPVSARDGIGARARLVLDAVPKQRPAAVESIARAAGLATEEASRWIADLHARGLVTGSASGWRLP